MVKTAQRICMAVLLALSTLVTAAEPVEFRKFYVDGPFGQIHVLQSDPVGVNDLQTPMACFAPNPSAGRYFKIFMGVLGSDRIMIAPDYPGLGESDPPPHMLDMTALAGSMARVLEELGYGDDGFGKVDVCGYHTGAMVALELAVSRRDLVRKVVLLGIPYYDEQGRAIEYAENVVDKPVKEDLYHLQESWEFAVTNRNEKVTLDRAYDNFVDVIQAKQYRTWAYHAVFTYPAENRAPLVTQPVLILNTHGSLENETREIGPLFPNARLVEIPELHHGIFDAGPELLAGHARPFLDNP